MNSCVFTSSEDIETFRQQLQHFGENTLIPCIDQFKQYCNQQCVLLWRAVRSAQIKRMRDQTTMPDGAVTQLVSFYSQMMFVLAVLGARLQVLFLTDFYDLISRVSVTIW